MSSRFAVIPPFKGVTVLEYDKLSRSRPVFLSEYVFIHEVRLLYGAKDPNASFIKKVKVTLHHL